MTAYYNEIDPYAAQWLRNLIDAGHIAPGVVDTRDIRDVIPGDLDGFTQCHFFAGIGVWSYALRRAGWADDRPVWTGSCPCQPFSVAGVGGGFDDERHLWPFFHHLIAQCRPGVVFGEQVASKDGLNWLDLVLADLAGEDYAASAVDLCAAGVGAPHIRQRLWFVGVAEPEATRSRESGLPDVCIGTGGLAHHHHQGLEGFRRGPETSRGWNAALRPAAASGESGGLADADKVGHDRSGAAAGEGRAQFGRPDATRHAGTARGLEHADSAGPRARERHDTPAGHGLAAGATCESGGLADANGGDAGPEREQRGGQQRQQQEDGGAGGVEHASSSSRRQRGQETPPRDEPDRQTPVGAEGEHGPAVAGTHRIHQHDAGPTNGFWRAADWLACRDGKWRPVEPGTFPLAHGAAARVGRLRAYGNAINAEAARVFIECVMEAAA